MVYKIYTVHKQELNTDNDTNLCNMKDAPCNAQLTSALAAL